MEITETAFDNLFELKFLHLVDDRGTFIKPFELDPLRSVFRGNAETYFSSSKKGVLRGLHFQHADKAQRKIVVCLSGLIEDIALDMRTDSKSYGKVYRKRLSGMSNEGVLIPEGFAHGIFSHDDSVIVNFCDKPYSPGDEGGVNWESLSELRDLPVEILSEKDLRLPAFNG